MSDEGAPWLATMRELAGVKEYAGGDNNPTILGWARFIGLTYPEMSGYADGYKHDAIPWCGLTMAYVLAKNGIRPPFGDNDLRRFLWANSFAKGWGLNLDTPRIGCIVVFAWPSGGGHVGVLDRIQGRTLYIAGGNQSDAVNVAPFSMEHVAGYVWPNAVAAAAAIERTPADVRQRMGKAITLAEARRDGQGHLAVYNLPANDGGGAYEVAGINERYHPVAAAKLKGLIESGKYQEAEDFVGDYTGAYTDVADRWTSSWGVEFYLRDCVFNRGPTGAAIIMQLALKSLGEDLGRSGKLRDGVDGEVGPLTAEAMRRQEGDPLRFLQSLRTSREHYERVGHQYINGGPHRDESSNFWNGLINRFNNALTVARRFHAEQPKGTTTMPDPQTPPPGSQPSPGPLPDMTNVGVDPKKMQDIMQAAMVAMIVVQMMQGKQMQIPTNLLPGPATQPEPPPVVQPAATPSPTPPAQSSIDKSSTVWGFLGLALSMLGQATGWFPVVGDPTLPVPAATGTALLTGGGIAALGGALNAASPILGTVFRIFSGAISAARSK